MHNEFLIVQSEDIHWSVSATSMHHSRQGEQGPMCHQLYIDQTCQLDKLLEFIFARLTRLFANDAECTHAIHELDTGIKPDAWTRCDERITLKPRVFRRVFNDHDIGRFNRVRAKGLTARRFFNVKPYDGFEPLAVAIDEAHCCNTGAWKQGQGLLGKSAKHLILLCVQNTKLV